MSTAILHLFTFLEFPEVAFWAIKLNLLNFPWEHKSTKNYPRKRNIGWFIAWVGLPNGLWKLNSQVKVNCYVHLVRLVLPPHYMHNLCVYFYPQIIRSLLMKQLIEEAEEMKIQMQLLQYCTLNFQNHNIL